MHKNFGLLVNKSALLSMLAVTLLLGCGGGTQDTGTSLASSSTTTPALPPSFTDAPPAPPTSDTYVLSGGQLQLAEPIADSIVVIRDGLLMAWGKRGETAVPNDSIGIDVRGKWLVTSAESMQIGQLANLRIFNTDPSSTESDDLHGIVQDGILELTQTP